MPGKSTLVVLFMLLLAGCASSPFSGDTNAQLQAYPGDNRTWHPLPRPGERIEVIDNATGAAMNVTVMDAYRAASGRTCALYTRTADNPENKHPSGLACRGNNHWSDLPFITNPDSRRPASS